MSWASPKIAYSPKLQNRQSISPLSSPKIASPKTRDFEGGFSVNDILASRKEKRTSRILRGYLYGQLGNVGKMAVWWSCFGPLIQGIAESEEAVGYTRLAFNIALVLVSPLAGVLAERIAVRKLLNITTVVRMFLWVVLIPVSWILMQSGIINHAALRAYFMPLLCVLLFIDGTQVAVSNVVDIDCGGLDLLGQQHDIEVTDATRNQFNSIHQMVFDGSFVFFTPLIAYVMLALSHQFSDKLDFDPSVQEVASLLAGMAGVFLVLSVFSLYYYNVRIPQPRADTRPLAAITGVAQESFSHQVGSVFRDIAAGAKICVRKSRIGWRLFFLALETSLEDSMVTVLISQMAMSTPIFADKDHPAFGYLWTAGIIAAGKVGAFCSGVFMHRFWEVPEQANMSVYRKLFWSVFVGGISAFLFPLARFLVIDHGMNAVGYVMVFSAAFIFFLFSTAPKIGFATLLQGLAAEEESSGKIFGFVATFITIMDAVIIMFLTQLFQHLDAQLAFWITAGVFALHGIVEALVGPYLVLYQGDERSFSATKPLLSSQERN